jgi:hypothetical protein
MRFIAFLFAFSLSILNAQVDPTDSLILIELYHALDGDNWTNNDGWLTNKPINEWYGISSQDGKVRVIHLQLNNLKGELPSSIGDLKNLTQLKLRNNQIYGNIPKEIGGMEMLQELSVDKNQLTGSIPDEMGRCSGLEILNLLENQLTALSDSLVRCSQLKELYAGENELTRFPQWIGELSELEVLWMHENEIDDTLPSGLSNLSKMKHLLLYKNMIYGELPSLKAMTQLKRLYVMQNQLEGDITDLLPDNSQISDFRIYNNNFAGHIDGSSFREDVLEKFWFSNNQISSLGDFSQFDQLTHLYIQHNRLNMSDILQFADRNITYFLFGGQAQRGQALDLEVPMDTTINLSTDADGAGTKYQWQKNGLWITGENATEMTIEKFSEEDNGTYDCFATNSKLPGFFLYTEKVKLKLTTTVSVDEEDQLGIRVYPNPAQDFIILETKEPLRLRWIGLDGRHVCSEIRLEAGEHSMAIPPSLKNSRVLLIETEDNGGLVDVVKLIHN